MSDTTPDVTRRPRRQKNDIHLPDGEVLTPREPFGEKEFGVSDRTARRMNLPTVYIGGVAFVKRNASLQIVGERAKQKNQPQRRRRRT